MILSRPASTVIVFMAFRDILWCFIKWAGGIIWWTEYCRGLYNHELHLDVSILQENLPPRDGEDSPPVLREEVEAAIRHLKAGKSPGVDNVPSELLKCGGEELAKAMTNLCQKIWEQRQWPTEWTQSLHGDTLTKEGQPQAMPELPYNQPD